MIQFVFSSNAKCSGCTARIDASLSPLLSAGSWSFDLSSPDRTLTVTDAPVSARQIEEAVRSAGYRAELLSEK